MKIHRTWLVSILATSFLLLALVYSNVVSADSRIDRSMSPTPTPTPIRMPTPVITDPARIKQETMPVVMPTPSPTPTPVIIQTLTELQTKIRQRLFAPDVRRGRVGIKIVSVDSGKVIFDNDSDKYFMPASNMKNFTVAAAMERLTPDFRFVTSVFAGSIPDAEGSTSGDIRIVGRGDVSISTAFSNGDYYKGLDDLAEKIKQTGVKKIEGGIIGDESYFKGFAIPGTWEWDDLQWYYGAEVSALPLNDNAVDLNVTPGSVGNSCIARIYPSNQIMQIINRCMTSAANTKRDLHVVKRLDQNVLEISGTMAAGDTGFKGAVSITHPAELFVALLKQRLESKGVTVKGSARVATPELSEPNRATQIEITRLESPPFAIIAAKTLKPSQNMYTETILWTLGEQSRLAAISSGSQTSSSVVATRPDSSELGLNVVKEFMKQIGVPDDGILQYDGSGLSRHDLITPSAVVTLYTYMAKQSKYAQAWRDSLTIGGVDGTLANRFKGTAAAGNIRGKTGTIDQVSALSGYLTTAGGDQIILSIIVNGVAESRQRTSLIDDIVVHLANFNGKIDLN